MGDVLLAGEMSRVAPWGTPIFIQLTVLYNGRYNLNCSSFAERERFSNLYSMVSPKWNAPLAHRHSPFAVLAYRSRPLVPVTGICGMENALLPILYRTMIVVALVFRSMYSPAQLRDSCQTTGRSVFSARSGRRL